MSNTECHGSTVHPGIRCASRWAVRVVIASSAAIVMAYTGDAAAWTHLTKSCLLGGSADLAWSPGARATLRCANVAFPGFPNSALLSADKS